MQYLLRTGLPLLGLLSAALLRPERTLAQAALTGYVFEDVNYGGGQGRPRSAGGAVARPGAKVELYDSNGAYVGTAITDGNGQYAFNAAAGSYTVRVVNNSVLSSRPGATAASGSATAGYVSIQIAVQTYNGTPNRVGGERPEYTDADANSGTQPLASLTSGTTLPESIANATVAGGTSANPGPDFGFSFDLVVNTNDNTADARLTPGSPSNQGSLRQFIANSNALGGESALAQVYTRNDGTTTALGSGVETSIFMIPNGTAVPGQQAGLTNQFTTSAQSPANTGLSGSAAIIRINSFLTAITGVGTVIDGSTETSSVGDTNQRSTTAGAESTGPEVLLDLNLKSSLKLNGNADQLLYLGVCNSLVVSQGVSVGAGDSPSAPATGVVISHNTIYRNGANVVLSPNSAATITDNIIRNSTRTYSSTTSGGTATETLAGDGIQLLGGNNGLTISGNQILRNGAFGINLTGINTGNTVADNLIAGDGTSTAGTRLAGISLRGQGSNNNTFTGNTLTGNNGAGIVAQAGTQGNIFSQNSFAGNGVVSGAGSAGRGLRIDLAAPNADDDGDGVTLNDPDDADASSNIDVNGSNGLISFPVLNTATLQGPTLTVSGYARPNTRVELYLATPGPAGSGDGATYLTTFTQANAAGTTGSVVTGAASAYANTQGTDNTLTFRYTYALSDVQKALLQASNAQLTSTATLTSNAGGNYGTSEFSGPVAVTPAPLPVTLVAFTAEKQGTDGLLRWRTALELNSAYFEVQASPDGSTWQVLGRVAAAGNSGAGRDYRYPDASLARYGVPVVYYRLRQVDLDAKAYFSPVVALGLDAPQWQATAYPNPYAHDLTVQVTTTEAGPVTVTVLDAAGRRVLAATRPAGTGTQVVALDEAHTLAAGTYTLLVRQNVHTATVRVTRQ